MNLPLEILIRILSHCNYDTLHVCRRLNKEIKDVLGQEVFDQQFFRGERLDLLVHRFRASQIKLHPAYEKFIFTAERFGKAYRFSATKRDKSKIFHVRPPFAGDKDLATNIPIYNILLQVNNGEIHEHMQPCAMTVLDLVNVSMGIYRKQVSINKREPEYMPGFLFLEPWGAKKRKEDKLFLKCTWSESDYRSEGQLQYEREQRDQFLAQTAGKRYISTLKVVGRHPVEEETP